MPGPKNNDTERTLAERVRLIREKPADYIEKTLPEDPSDRAGQQTRDNVTPAIPSTKRGKP